MDENMNGGRPFTDILRDLAGGMTAMTITEKLEEVSMAVLETGKEGALTLTLKIKPNGLRSVFITDEIKTKIPDMPRGDTIFFADDAGTLVRDDPRQGKLDLKEVPTNEPGPLMEVNHG